MDNKENKQDIDILSDEEIEEIDVSELDAEEDEEKNPHTALKIVLLSVVAVIVAGIVCVYLIRTRLSSWSKTSASVDKSGITDGMYDIELNDYYVYIDEEIMAGHPDDGEENILLIGNTVLTHEAGGKSLADAIGEKLNANIYLLATDYGKVTNNTPAPEGPNSVADSFSLCRIVDTLVTGNTGPQVGAMYYSKSIFAYDSDERADEYINTITTIDMDKIDTIIIMYSLVDYYQSVPTLVLEEEQVNCYYGALLKAVTTLQNAYPYINIVLSSPTPNYIEESDGSYTYSTLKNYGFGNSSAYIELLYYVATKCCVSYIDNYAYGITIANITDYIDNFELTEAGIELVSNHIANFMITKPVAIEVAPQDYDN